MGGSDGIAGSRRVGAVCNSVPVAVSALSCDRLDVSRRLFARGNFDAAGSGPRWDADFPPNHFDFHRTDWNWVVAIAPWIGGRFVFFWRAGRGDWFVVGLFLGGGVKIEGPREVVYARA